MPEQIITPNEKVNEHIEYVQALMLCLECGDSDILLVSKVIHASYVLGQLDANTKTLGMINEET